jgi:hypothetical protein
MADKTPPKAPANPLIGLIMAVVVAALGLAVYFYPPLKPVCQALGGCADPVEQPATPE